MRYSDSTALKSHKRSHTTDKPYHCADCDLYFKSPNNLSRHRKNMHTEKVLQYGCDVCGARFSDLGTFKSHKRTHTTERPYQCVDCGQYFKSPNNLSRHRKNIHAKELL
jgi:uncharacterized Zn-finger protein